MNVHLRMIGCRLNQSEIDMLARQFEQQGHTIVDNPDDAHQIIVNTCAVTQDAVKAGRKLINDLHRARPTAEVTVTGCHAQIAPDEIAVLGGVKRVVSNVDKQHIVTHITGQAPQPFDIEPIERDKPLSMRTRAFVKVQDGCDNACTFCVTTVARGAGVSRTPDDLLNEIHYLASIGYQEVVLTGVHLGSYGHDLENPDGLKHLTQRILRETSVPRLRLSSLEPWDLSEGFFSLWQDERLCPHLHLPLQSGCDTTLKRMRRNTNQADFSALMREARQIPDVRITTDIIVGFPAETEEEFEESEQFIREMAFDGLHVFRYSSRPNTPASRMRGQVPHDKRKERSQRLIAYSTAQEMRFAEAHTGKMLPVLWENVSGATPEGFINVGYTHNYIRVQAVHPRVLTNFVTPAQLRTPQEGITWAVPVIE